jgi:DNA-binding winged helix-turn-helix (wHTH) protein/tetratricopeptide (TPR) repeat protein
MTAMRIDLGLMPPMRLGALTLNPPVRAIRRDDGAEEVVEPRVMQVLLALAKARGDIVRREDLSERCWEGRVVGEDAINRVLSRLRRVSEGIGSGSFRIETITKIGYRLVELGVPEAVTVEERNPVFAPSSLPPLAPVAASPPFRPTRRTALFGAAAVGGLALAGGGFWWRRHRSDMPADARKAMERGMDALRMMSLDAVTTAVAAFRQAADLAPGFAEPWGWLAFAYNSLYIDTHGEEAGLNAQRAREAANKALALDPANEEAQAALAALLPLFRNWLAFDAACKPVLASHPDGFAIRLVYLEILANVGRINEVNAVAQRLMSEDAGWPKIYSNLASSSWCLGRLDDADAVSDRAIKLWPRYSSTWFVRQRLLAYSGRAAAALAMVEDVDHRPVGLPAWDFDLAAAECRALLTRSKADIDAASVFYWERARTSVGMANNAIQFFGAVGRLDDAFTLLDALYFNRGFDIGSRQYTEEQGTYSERRNRATWLFWFPFMADLRADPRLGAILQEIGLVDYWRKSGTRPIEPIAGVNGS